VNAWLRDLGLAAAGGSLLALSPLTTHHLLPSAAIGTAGGALAFGFLRRRRPSGVDVARDWAATPGTAARAIPLGVLALLALHALLFAPTLSWMFEHWSRDVWVNNHGLFVPPLVAGLSWLILSRDGDRGEDASAWGFAFLVPGLLLLVSDAVIQSSYLAALGFLMTLPGLSLLLLGARRTRLLAMPLALTLLMLPIPRTLATQLQLQEITAWGSHLVLVGLGLPVTREGLVLFGVDQTWTVREACSGFSTLYAALAVSLLLACFSRSHARRGLLLLSAPIFALLANVMRVVVLVAISHYAGRWTLDTWLHGASGVAALLAALFGIFLLADRRGLRESFS
jgi:exosortase